jgi:hypothetical protein
MTDLTPLESLIWLLVVGAFIGFVGWAVWTMADAYEQLER